VQVSQARKAAEVGKEDWGAVAQAPPWAVDAWGLGCLMQEAYSGQPLQRTEELRNLEDIPKSVAQVGPDVPDIRGGKFDCGWSQMGNCIQPTVQRKCISRESYQNRMSFQQCYSRRGEGRFRNLEHPLKAFGVGFFY